MTDVTTCARPGCRQPVPQRAPGRAGGTRRFCGLDCVEWVRRRREGRALRADALELGPVAPLLDTPGAAQARAGRLWRALCDGTPTAALRERFSGEEVRVAVARARREGVRVEAGRDVLPLGIPA